MGLQTGQSYVLKKPKLAPFKGRLRSNTLDAKEEEVKAYLTLLFTVIYISFRLRILIDALFLGSMLEGKGRIWAPIKGPKKAVSRAFWDVSSYRICRGPGTVWV